jgi:tRNA(Leu) C34 or U34 (ribose-2'-O)-methylase TrmL
MEYVSGGWGYCGIGLDNPKNRLNVGSVMRAAGVYGAAFVAATGGRYGRAVTDVQHHLHQIPFLRPQDLRDVIPFGCVPVGVDIVEGATALPLYRHPDRAFYIFGAEDATLGRRILSWCRDTVFVPTNGSMNLAATVNVILYDRLAKAYSDQKSDEAHPEGPPSPEPERDP